MCGALCTLPYATVAHPRWLEFRVLIERRPGKCRDAYEGTHLLNLPVVVKNKRADRVGCSCCA